MLKRLISILSLLLLVVLSMPGSLRSEDSADNKDGERKSPEETFFFSEDKPEPDSPLLDNAFEEPD
ncbi:MAG: hypothetical protein KDK23_17005, partial [Leptospiraceae bacterium]|nr:hypothetical protein [Leptospiraceae bacterium]